MILVFLILIPFLSGLLSWYMESRDAVVSRWIAVCGLALNLALVITIWAQVGFPQTGGPWIDHFAAGWIPQLGITFQLDLDGISLLLVTLTIILGIASVVTSWTEIQDRVGFFHFNLLTVLAGIIGVFLATDLILFYFFWEVMLVPMYFLIAIWGHENRIYAAIKFFIFTQAGGLLMLVSILALGILHGKTSGTYTFDYFQLSQTPIADPVVGMLLALGFIAAFAVKLPVVVLHTWLPDAHTEAPTAGSVILAGLLLKTGGYGFLRFVLPLFPNASIQLAPYAMALGVIGIIYGAVLALGQRDIKRLVAYSSVSHMGFVLIGIFAFSMVALQGAVAQMVAHGLTTGGLFIIVGLLQQRIHTRDMDRMGGLWVTAPLMGGAMLALVVASLGLPGSANFAGEFLTLLGVYKSHVWAAVLGAAGLVLAAAYSLWLMARVFFGPRSEVRSFGDLSPRELGLALFLILSIFAIGLYPQPIIDTASPALKGVNTCIKFCNQGSSKQRATIETPAQRP